MCSFGSHEGPTAFSCKYRGKKDGHNKQKLIADSRLSDAIASKS